MLNLLKRFMLCREKTFKKAMLRIKSKKRIKTKRKRRRRIKIKNKNNLILYINNG